MHAPVPLAARLAAILFGIVAMLAAGLAHADDAADRAAALDDLFAQLAAAPNAEAAHRLEQGIWLIWTSPADPDIRLRMLDVMEARQFRSLDQTLVLLDDLVGDFPEYSEGWNQRATIYYLLGRNTDSLADIDKVLALEPRHFGALAGRAMIYLSQGKRALALRDMATALALHPFLPERQMFPELQPMTRT